MQAATLAMTAGLPTGAPASASDPLSLLGAAVGAGRLKSGPSPTGAEVLDADAFKTQGESFAEALAAITATPTAPALAALTMAAPVQAHPAAAPATSSLTAFNLPEEIVQPFGSAGPDQPHGAQPAAAQAVQGPALLPPLADASALKSGPVDGPAPDRAPPVTAFEQTVTASNIPATVATPSAPSTLAGGTGPLSEAPAIAPNLAPAGKGLKAAIAKTAPAPAAPANASPKSVAPGPARGGRVVATSTDMPAIQSGAARDGVSDNLPATSDPVASAPTFAVSAPIPAATAAMVPTTTEAQPATAPSARTATSAIAAEAPGGSSPPVAAPTHRVMSIEPQASPGEVISFTAETIPAASDGRFLAAAGPLKPSAAPDADGPARPANGPSFGGQAPRTSMPLSVAPSAQAVTIATVTAPAPKGAMIEGALPPAAVAAKPTATADRAPASTSPSVGQAGIEPANEGPALAAATAKVRQQPPGAETAQGEASPAMRAASSETAAVARPGVPTEAQAGRDSIQAAGSAPTRAAAMTPAPSPSRPTPARTAPAIGEPSQDAAAGPAHATAQALPARLAGPAAAPSTPPAVAAAPDKTAAAGLAASPQSTLSPTSGGAPAPDREAAVSGAVAPSPAQGGSVSPPPAQVAGVVAAPPMTPAAPPPGKASPRDLPASGATDAATPYAPTGAPAPSRPVAPRERPGTLPADARPAPADQPTAMSDLSAAKPEAPTPTTAQARPDAAVFTAPAAAVPVDNASPAPQAAALAAQSVTQTVARLSDQMVQKLEARSTRFLVALEPAGLGRVDVRVEIGEGGKLTAALNFDNPQSAQALQAHAPELRRQLESAGFDLSGGGLSFTTGGAGGDASGGQAQGGRTWSAPAASTFLSQDADAPAVPAQNYRKTTADGRLDIRI